MKTNELVNELYRVFSRYRFKPNFVARCSPIKPPTNEEIRAFSQPLRKLSDDGLGGLPLSLMTTWGDEEDFKYFFPRIAESSVISIENDLFDYAFFPRLKDVNLEDWQEDERKLVYALLKHYIMLQIENFTNEQGFIGYLADAVSLLGIERLKKAFIADRTESSAFFIANQLLNASTEIKEFSKENKAHLESWFKSDEAKDVLQKGIVLSKDETITYTIQIALNNII